MITTEALSKRYGATVAVDNLSVEVRPGSVTGFLGPNGAGKSTTLRMVMGLNRPTAGTALIDGRPYRQLRRPLHHVGALLDASAVPPGPSGFQYLAAIARTNGIGRSRVSAVLDEVGLASVARRRVRSYSLGMKQRLGIAAALLGDPPVLIFDEPINGLDPDGIRWIRLLFRRLADEGRTVLVSSHVMSEMEHTADRLIVIGAGRLLAHTTVADFIRRGSSDTVTVRTPSKEALEQVLRAADAQVTTVGDLLEVSGLHAARIGDLALANRIAVHELVPHSAGLEQAFMDLTAETGEHRAGSNATASR
ncbi:ATP-binding cassette domain-containing protein [Kitasatospora sp. GP82]|uniref:ABC transporter ATP-binding protein n=1 Tax=Kitasatospora sp. GP82 TaxID=3035089 RepID=UPI002476E37F|nr:ATP-binding cassette domain-containing protein [Kitasatospora sp. GP82]MDH6123594.1 ABC-2 type transport system ATP-binding protein [Kitasatospora sp. GP82]